MASPVTKRSGIDNITPRLKGTCEVWWYSKHADVEHGTGKVLNNEGVPENSLALKIAIDVALDSWNRK